MLSVKTIMGASWSVSSRLASRLIDFLTLLVLGRMLSPEDFGLTALAMTVIAVAETVLELPLIQALTRLPEIRVAHLNTAFTLGVLRSLVLGAIIVAAAWPFSKIYNDPRLVPVIAALAIGPVARGLYSPAMVKYYREMQFRPIFICEVVGKMTSACITLAILLLGGGYFALVANSILASSIATVISYCLAPYRPKVSLAELPEFASFIGWFSSSQLVAALNWQFDRFFLGHYINKLELGKYTMASDLAVLPTQSLIGPAMQPVMAAFSRMNAEPARLQNAYLKASRFAMLIAMPVCIGMALTADLIIAVLLGAKWADSGIYLRWIAISATLSAYIQPLYSLTLATGRVSNIFKLNLMDLTLKVILISLGFHYYSMVGVIGARCIVALIMFAMTLIVAQAVSGASLMAQIMNLWQIVVACAAMAVVVVWTKALGSNAGLTAPLLLIAEVGAGVLAYGAVILGSTGSVATLSERVGRGKYAKPVCDGWLTLLVFVSGVARGLVGKAVQRHLSNAIRRRFGA